MAEGGFLKVRQDKTGYPCKKHVAAKLKFRHPRKLTWNLKMKPWKRRFLLETLKKPSFSGSMLVFGGVGKSYRDS